MKRLVFSLAILGLGSALAAQPPLFVPQTEATPLLPEAPRPSAAPYSVQRIPLESQPVPQPLYAPAAPQPYYPPSVPAQPHPQYGAPVPYEQIFVPQAPSLAMYDRVRVRQTRNMHPHAVPTLVAIKNPCFGGSCVYVEVCVPPCGPAEVKCFRRGDAIRLDYGKYSVDIVSTRRGVVVIDYND